MHRFIGSTCLLMRMGGKAEHFDPVRCVSELCEEGFLAEAVSSSELIAQQGVPLPVHLLYCLLRECIKTKDLEVGRRVHKLIVRGGVFSHRLLGNHLIRLYALGENLEEVRLIFDKLPQKDKFIWTSIITAYVRHGQGEQAIALFFEMLQSPVKPNAQTYAAVLNGCASIADLTRGKLIHAHIINSKLECDVLIGNSLIDMYSKCGCFEAARKVFLRLPGRTVVSWTAMIAGCVQHGHVQQALQLFEKMQKQGLKPDRVTFLCMLKACSGVDDLELGRAIHAQILKTGLKLDVHLGSSLVNMYSRCGNIRDARQVFLGLSDRDVVLWNTMIVGCAKHGHFLEVLHLFKKMLKDGLKPNTVTYVGVLKACGGTAALEKGEYIHSQLAQSGIDSNLFVGNALIDMYAKCGRIDRAIQVFTKLTERDIVSWNAIIDGCAQQGYGEDALRLFKRMCQEGVKPDAVTLVCVLSACSHAGLVDEAYSFFWNMSNDFSISPCLEHYTCMVDLLCRCGKLFEAREFIDKMPIQPNVALWMSLLGACRTYGNLEIGKHAFDSIIELEPGNASAYALISNMYAVAGRGDDEAFIRKEMDCHLGRKEMDCHLGKHFEAVC